MINSVSSSSYSVGQMSGVRNRSATGGAEQAGSREKPNLSELFAKLDADSSGGLGSDEVQNLTEMISEATGVSVDLSEFLATYDTNGDANLSEEESIVALEANRPQGPPPPPPGGMGGMQGKGPDESGMVDAADTNGDGVISTEEAAGLVDIINHATGSELKAEDFITTYDENGDGSFSTDEAIAAMKANRPEEPFVSGASSTSGSVDAASSAFIEQYLQMAALGMEEQTGTDLFSLLSERTGSVRNVA